MASEWKSVQLGDVLTLQRGFDLPLQNRQVGQVPIIASTGNVGSHNEHKVTGPGVVIGRSGSIGGGQFISEDFWPLNTTLWVKDFKDNDVRYCYYLIKSIDFSSYNVGSGVPTLNRNHVHPHPVFLAPATEQQAIASILGALDDKIDLNRRMNETLESMARAIFKSWFVDFDPVRAKMEGKQPYGMDAETAALFPDRLVESELGLIPEGWDMKPLDQIADYVNGAACQKYKAEHGEASLPVLKIREINQGVTAQTDRATIEIPNKHRGSDGDVLFSWSGTLICKIWTGGEGFVNQHVFKVSSAGYPRWFFLYWTKQHLDEFKRIAADKATTMGHIKRSHLSSSLAAIPSDDLLQAGTRTIGHLDDLRVSNNLESRTLAELRDLLLPKLLSGEIRVKEAEQMEEAAV